MGLVVGGIGVGTFPLAVSVVCACGPGQSVAGSAGSGAEGGSFEDSGAADDPGGAGSCNPVGDDEPASVLVAFDTDGSTALWIDTTTGVELTRLQRPSIGAGAAPTAVLPGGAAMLGGIELEMLPAPSCGVDGSPSSGTETCGDWTVSEPAGSFIVLATRSRALGCLSDTIWGIRTADGISPSDSRDSQVVQISTLDGHTEEVASIAGTQWAIASDDHGDLWAVEYDGPLYRVRAQDLSVSQWDVPWSAEVSNWQGITVDERGFVYACSDALARFDPGTEQWDSRWVLPKEEAGGATNCLADPFRDVIWMVTDIPGSDANGFAAYDPDTLERVSDWFTLGQVRDVSLDSSGRLWASTGGVIYAVEPLQWEVVHVITAEELGLDRLVAVHDATGLVSASAGAR